VGRRSVSFSHSLDDTRGDTVPGSNSRCVALGCAFSIHATNSLWSTHKKKKKQMERREGEEKRGRKKVAERHIEDDITI